MNNYVNTACYWIVEKCLGRIGIPLFGLVMGICLIYFDDIQIKLLLVIASICALGLLWDYRLLFLYTLLFPIIVGIIKTLGFEGSALLGLGDEALIFVCLCILLLKFIVQGTSKLGAFKYVLFCLIYFTVSAVCSSLLNGFNAVALLNYLSTFYKPFILVTALLCILDHKYIIKMVNILIIVGLFETVLATIQFFSYDTMNILVASNTVFLEDSATGTFGPGGAHLLGHFMIILFMYCCTVYIYTREKIFLFLCGIYLYCFILSNTEQDYIILFIYIIGFVIIKSKMSIIKRMALIIIMLVSCVILSNRPPDIVQRYVKYLTNPSTIKASGKVEGLKIVEQEMLRGFGSLLLGSGPGSFATGAAEKYQGKLYKKYIAYRIEDIKSTVDFPWSGLTSIMCEVGSLGFIFYYSGFICIIFQLIKMARNIEDRFQKANIIATICICFYILFLSLLINIFEFAAIMFPVSIFIGYCYRILSACRKQVVA